MAKDRWILWERQHGFIDLMVAVLYFVLIAAYIGLSLALSYSEISFTSSRTTSTLYGTIAGLLHVLLLDHFYGSKHVAKQLQQIESQRLPKLEARIAPSVMYAACTSGDDATVSRIMDVLPIPLKAAAWGANIAVGRGHTKVASEIVARLPAAAFVSFDQTSGETLAHAAVGSGSLDLLKTLIDETRVPINIRRQADDLSLLHMAVATNHRNIVQYLVSNGADCSAISTSGYTPLHFATGADIVHDLCQELSVPQLKASLEKGEFTEGKTPLHLAAYRGNIEVVHTLLQSGADADAYGTHAHKVAPLHLAACSTIRTARVPIARALLDAGAKPNYCAGSSGATPLGIAAAKGDAALAWLLLSYGAAPAAMNKAGLTPAKLASNAGHSLLASDLNVVTAFSASQILAAARMPNRAAKLLRNGLLDPLDRGHISVTAAHIAASPWRARPICPATRKLFRVASQSWAPKSHFLFGPKFRTVVHLILLCQQRLESTQASLWLPIEMWFAILGALRRADYVEDKLLKATSEKIRGVQRQRPALR